MALSRLWPCRVVALSRCRLVALWPCRVVALWPCGLVALWRLSPCGLVALWPNPCLCVCVLCASQVELPKKHGRGGQSSVRFARLRLEKRHNYLRKVAETATQMFITSDKPNVKGLVLAGSADFKTDLAKSDLFDPRLSSIVVQIVDISYGGENGFNQVRPSASRIAFRCVCGCGCGVAVDLVHGWILALVVLCLLMGVCCCTFHQSLLRGIAVNGICRDMLPRFFEFFVSVPAQAIQMSAEALASVKFMQEKKLITTYFDEIALDTGKYCFGVKDTLNVRAAVTHSVCLRCRGSP